MDALKNTDTITVQQDVHFVCQKKFFSGMFKYNINMRYNYVYIYIYILSMQQLISMIHQIIYIYLQCDI